MADDTSATAAPRATWIPISPDSPFPLHNLPFGVGRRPDGTVGAFVAIGDGALDLARAGSTGLLDGTWGQHGLLGPDGTLNDFAGAGRSAHSVLRERLIEVFTDAGIGTMVVGAPDDTGATT